MSEKENLEKHEHSAVEKPEKVDVKKLEADAEIGSVASEVSADAMKTIEGAESAESAKTFSEKGDDKIGDSTGGGATSNDEDDAVNLFAHIQKTVSEKQMQREVASAIRKEIRKEEQKILLAYAGIKKYPPDRLAEKVAKIRSLKDLLGSIVDATKEFLTGLYLKWVRKSV